MTTGSRVQSLPRAFTFSFDVALSLLNLTNIRLQAVSLFLQIFEGSVRPRERRAAKPRGARNEEAYFQPEKKLVSRLRSRAWSFACLALFARRTKKKGRLLVVSTDTSRLRKKGQLPAVTGLSFEESSCVVSDESCMVVGFPWDFSGNKLVEEPSSSDAIIALADEGDSNLVAELNIHTQKTKKFIFCSHNLCDQNYHQEYRNYLGEIINNY